MKNLKSIIALLILTSINSVLFAQKDSIFISKFSDEMSEKTYYFPSRKMICASEDKKTGFSLCCFLDYKDDKIKVKTLKVVMVNIGSCVENNEIIILFENDTKIKLKSWNDFNCKGDAWFDLSSSDLESLKSLKMKKIKVTNGRSYESFTSDTLENSDYFTQIFFAIDNNKIKEEKK